MRAEEFFPALCSRGFLFLFLLLLQTGCSREHPGEHIYQKNCSPCHLASGQGLRKLYPSLDKSRYLSSGLDKLPCLIIHGSTATIKATGSRRGSSMPAIKSIPTAELLLLIDYLQRRWSPHPVPVSEPVLVKWLSSCAT